MKKLYKDERYPSPRVKLEGIRTFCPEDGFDVEIDEDGCCRGCGALAVGNAVDKLHITEQPFRWVTPSTTGLTSTDNIKEVMEEVMGEAWETDENDENYEPGLPIIL